MDLVNEAADRVFSGCYGKFFSSFSAVAKYKIAFNCFYGFTGLVYSWHNQICKIGYWLYALIKILYKFQEIRWRGAAANPESTLISGTKKRCIQVMATAVFFFLFEMKRKNDLRSVREMF